MKSASFSDDPSTAQSLSPLDLSCSSIWNSTVQAKNPPPKNIVSGSESSPNFFDHVKQSEPQFQDQDSSSTQSSCQSQYAMGNTARNNTTVQNLGSRHGIDETSAIHAENRKRCNSDYVFGQLQFDYNDQMACIPYQWAESCLGAVVAAYGPKALVYPQMLGINQARVPIPLDCAESIPVYVNAKQFRAILRRRQTRAKLEAQNKFVKTRKPYLHESRHCHAVKRERGPGGRFLNKKDTNQSNASLPKHCQDISHQQLDGGVSSTEVQHSDCGSWETSTPSGSDVTSIFSGGDIFRQPEIRLSTFHMDPHVGDDLTHLEAGNRLFLSIAGCAPK